MGDNVGPFPPVGRRFRVPIPNCQSQLAEWFIGLWSQIQYFDGESSDRAESELDGSKAREASTKTVKQDLVNFIGWLERIQQSDMRWHSGSRRGIEAIAE